MANLVHAPQGKRINALSMLERHGNISKDIILAPVRRPTKGRTSSLANRVHVPQGKRINTLSMLERHGIISKDITPYTRPQYPCKPDRLPKTNFLPYHINASPGQPPAKAGHNHPVTLPQAAGAGKLI